jgi:hypothetical protein
MTVSRRCWEFCFVKHMYKPQLFSWTHAQDPVEVLSTVHNLMHSAAISIEGNARW